MWNQNDKCPSSLLAPHRALNIALKMTFRLCPLSNYLSARSQFRFDLLLQSVNDLERQFSVNEKWPPNFKIQTQTKL